MSTAERASGQVELSVDRVPPRTYGIDATTEMFADVDARVVGPEATDYEFREATAAGGEVTNVFITSTGQRVHFHLAPAMPASERSSEVRVVFASTKGAAPLVVVAPFRINADRTITVPSGATTSRGGIYSGPVPHYGQILFGTDPLVHIGSPTVDPDRKQGTPERAMFRPVSFYTWLDAKVEGMVVGAPAASAGAGTIAVYYTEGREARLVFDPRDARGRLVPGRHAITVRWCVKQRSGPLRLKAEQADFEDTIHAVVSDDGTIAVGG